MSLSDVIPYPYPEERYEAIQGAYELALWLLSAARECEIGAYTISLTPGRGCSKRDNGNDRRDERPLRCDMDGSHTARQMCLVVMNNPSRYWRSAQYRQGFPYRFGHIIRTGNRTWGLESSESLWCVTLRARTPTNHIEPPARKLTSSAQARSTCRK